MERDTAIRKVALRMSEPVPVGLEARLMSGVTAYQEKKRRRGQAFGIALASFASMVLIGGVVFIMKTFFPLRPEIGGLSLELTEQSTGLLVFSCYIAGIVLLLLFLDTYIRQVKHHSVKH